MKRNNYVVRILSLGLSLTVLLGGCSAFGRNKKERPVIGIQKDLSKQAVVFVGDEYSEEFSRNATVELSNGESAYFYNYKLESAKKMAMVTNMNLPSSGNVSIAIAQYEVNDLLKTAKIVLSSDKSVVLISDDGTTKETLLETNITAELAPNFAVTLEYDNGILSFWVDDEYLFGQSYDLKTVSADFDFYGGFYCDGTDATFKFIKIFGAVEFVPFNIDSIIEGCTDIVPSKTIKYLGAKSEDGKAGKDYMINYKSANRFEIPNLGLDYSKPIAYSFTIKTVSTDESWNGFRPTFLQDSVGNGIKLFSLEGSVLLCYYNATTRKDESLASAAHERVLGEEENYFVYFNKGVIYIFINGELLLEFLYYESDYTPIFKPLFEFGNVEVTNIKIYQANDVVVY